MQGEPRGGRGGPAGFCANPDTLLAMPLPGEPPLCRAGLGLVFHKRPDQLVWYPKTTLSEHLLCVTNFPISYLNFWLYLQSECDPTGGETAVQGAERPTQAFRELGHQHRGVLTATGLALWSPLHAPSHFILSAADARRSIAILILQTGKLRLSEKKLGQGHPADKG